VGGAGNRDYAPYLAVGGALAWWRAHGSDARQYMHATLQAVVQQLLQRWQSATVAPMRLCAAMACVRLPAALQSRPPGTSDSAAAKQLQVPQLHATRRSLAALFSHMHALPWLGVMHALHECVVIASRAAGSRS